MRVVQGMRIGFNDIKREMNTKGGILREMNPFSSIYSSMQLHDVTKADIHGAIQFKHNYRYNFRCGASYVSEGLNIALYNGDTPYTLLRYNSISVADDLISSCDLTMIRLLFGKVINPIKSDPFMLSIPTVEDESIELERKRLRYVEKEKKILESLKRRKVSKGVGWITNPDYNNLKDIPPFDRKNFSIEMSNVLRF